MTHNELNGTDSIFDTPTSRVLDAALPTVEEVLRRLLREPPRGITTLRKEIRSYMLHLHELSKESEFLDLKLARQVAFRCEALLDGLTPESTPEIQRLVQASVRYFIKHDDEENDIGSPIGFDDDAGVVKLVARAIGREDVLDLEPPEDM